MASLRKLSIQLSTGRFGVPFAIWRPKCRNPTVRRHRCRSAKFSSCVRKEDIGLKSFYGLTVSGLDMT